MVNFNAQGPIVAISTGTQEKSALGIVRVSGFTDPSFLNKLTNRAGIFEPRKAYFSSFVNSGGEMLDEGIFILFQAPNSFTGENIAEFNLHGNPLLLERFVQCLVNDHGFKRAKPGEFSYRALRNNKLNLTQVEGLDLLLNANSSFGLKAGTEILHNKLFKEYEQLRKYFLEMKASLELLIDFSEDVGEKEIKDKLEKDMDQFTNLIEKLYKRTQGRLSDALAPSIGLFGQTNAGKSTFFNFLYGENRAIVSDTHGTTRDYISETISLDKQTFKLIDTAGIRESGENVEKEGIKRSLELLESCFYKILVVNPFHELHLKIPSDCDAVVLTHSDCKGFISVSERFIGKYKGKIFKNSGPIGAISNSGPIGPSLQDGPMGAKHMSGSIGAGPNSGPIGAVSISGPIEPGISLESDIVIKYQALMDTNPVPIERHRDEISSIYCSFNELLATYRSTDDLAIISSIFSRLGSSLDQLIGVVSPQDVLDHIFSNFCIGK